MRDTGSIIGITALVLINFAWNQGPVVGWDTPYNYILLLIGFIFLALFVWVELRTSHPLVPFKDLSRSTAFVLGCVSLGWACFACFAYYFYLFLRLRGFTPLSIAAQMSTVSVSGTVAALSTGFLLARLGPEIVMIIALIAFCLGPILVMTSPLDQTYWAQAFIALVVMPFGMVSV